MFSLQQMNYNIKDLIPWSLIYGKITENFKIEKVKMLFDIWYDILLSCNHYTHESVLIMHTNFIVLQLLKNNIERSMIINEIFFKKKFFKEFMHHIQTYIEDYNNCDAYSILLINRQILVNLSFIDKWCFYLSGLFYLLGNIPHLNGEYNDLLFNIHKYNQNYPNLWDIDYIINVGINNN